MFTGTFHQTENVEEIFGNVMIFLEEKDHAGMVPGDGQLIEHVIRFPPPMMFRLRKLGLSVVPIEVRMFGVDATEIQSSERLRVDAQTRGVGDAVDRQREVQEEEE